LWERHPIPDWREFAAVLALGGPMGVSDERDYPFLAEEKRVIAEVARAGHPFLGVCLGAQLLAAGLGAEVFQNPVKECGLGEVWRTEAAATDPLFSALPERVTVFQWHGDAFALPAGATLLATNPHCTHQAFRFNRAWGLLFHLEVRPPMAEAWAAADLEWLNEGDRPVVYNAHNLGSRPNLSSRQIADDIRSVGPVLEQQAAALFNAFLDLC